MKRAEHIQEELNELGAKILMSTSSIMPYSLPIHYFARFGDEITDIIKIGEQPEANPEWSNRMPFEAPSAAYFEGLSAQIIAKANTEPDIKWNKSNPFAVPQGYFESLPKNIIEKAKAKEAVAPKIKKTIPLFRTVQLAASMALMIFAGFAVIRMSNNQTTNTVAAISASDAEIKNYVNENLDDFDTDLIINSLASNTSKSGSNIDISDAEIKEYLDETGWN